MSVDEVSSDVMDRYRKVDVATVYTGLSDRGYEICFMRGVHAYTPGERLVARARTLRYLPVRPDLQAEKRGGTPGNYELNNPEAPEYLAMGMCGPGDVLVCDGMRNAGAANLGDVKLFQLKMQHAEGLVTDGGIRDLKVVAGYGLKVFAGGRTPTAARFVMTEAEHNVDIQCGGVLVRPGDLIVGDDDGVVVVPKQLASDIIDWVEEHEAAEEWVKEKVIEENVAPGKYYPPTDALKKKLREG